METSKHNQVRQYLLNGNELSGLKALNLFQLYRLSSVVNRLRNEGLDIKTRMLEDKDTGASYAMYYIEQKKDVSS